MQKKNLLTLIISQTIAFPFLFVGAVGWIAEQLGYEIMIFGMIGTEPTYKSLAVFCFIEFWAVILLGFINRKNVVLFGLLLLFLSGFFLFGSGFTIRPIQLRTLQLEQFKEEILITDTSFLMGGDATIYEIETPFLLKRIASVSGDDGYCPLKRTEDYRIEIKGTEIYIYYKFRQGNLPENDRLLILKWNGDSIEKKEFVNNQQKSPLP